MRREEKGGRIIVHLDDHSLGAALDMVADEVERARRLYPAFHSGHEGIAVIQEEVDELWADVKASKGLRQSAQAGAEAIQVAAMALRFLMDLCEVEDVAAFIAGKRSV